MGVYDKAELSCTFCKRTTLHNTGWESEEPDVLETECTICKRLERRGPRFLNQVLRQGKLD